MRAEGERALADLRQAVGQHEVFLAEDAAPREGVRLDRLERVRQLHVRQQRVAEERALADRGDLRVAGAQEGQLVAAVERALLNLVEVARHVDRGEQLGGFKRPRLDLGDGVAQKHGGQQVLSPERVLADRGDAGAFVLAVRALDIGHDQQLLHVHRLARARAARQRDGAAPRRFLGDVVIILHGAVAVDPDAIVLLIGIVAGGIKDFLKVFFSDGGGVRDLINVKLDIGPGRRAAVGIAAIAVIDDVFCIEKLFNDFADDLIVLNPVGNEVVRRGVHAQAGKQRHGHHQYQKQRQQPFLHIHSPSLPARGLILFAAFPPYFSSTPLK